jgi:hypothetical protein
VLGAIHNTREGTKLTRKEKKIIYEWGIRSLAYQKERQIGKG